MLNIGRSDLRCFARKNLQTCLGVYLQPVRAKCGAASFSPPVGKNLNILKKIESLSLVDTSFAPRGSPRPLKKKMAMPPSSTGHGDQHDQIFTL